MNGRVENTRIIAVESYAHNNDFFATSKRPEPLHLFEAVFLCTTFIMGLYLGFGAFLRTISILSGSYFILNNLVGKKSFSNIATKYNTNDNKRKE